jgi:hypothetical protein
MARTKHTMKPISSFRYLMRSPILQQVGTIGLLITYNMRWLRMGIVKSVWQRAGGYAIGF